MEDDSLPAGGDSLQTIRWTRKDATEAALPTVAG
jgi:hypothetical protein